MLIEDTFHAYIRPTVNPQLTSYCTGLTGIIQEMVDTSQTFNKVFKDFQKWMFDTKLVDSCEFNAKPLAKFTFVTCGKSNQLIRLSVKLIFS